MGEKVNATELGRRIGVSEAAVRKHVKKGLYKPDRDGLFDAERCKAAWEIGRDPDAALKGVAGAEAVSFRPGGMAQESSLSRARAANATLQAQRQKIALERETGLLIKTEDAFAACRAVITTVNERLDGAAAQIGPRVVGLDAAAAERVAKEVLRGVRQEIAALASSVVGVARGNS